MSRHPHLEWIRDTWYAVFYHPVYLDGEVKYGRKRYSLKIQGKSKRKIAERALRNLQLELERESSTPADVISTAEYAAQFLAAKQHTVRPTTFRAYNLWVTRFILRFGSLPLRSISPDMVEGWIRELIPGHTAETVNTAYRYVRPLFSRAVQQRIIQFSPFTGVQLIDVPKRTFAPFWTREQFDSFLTGVTSDRHRAGFCLAFYAGLRAKEVIQLKWEDVNPKYIHVVNREGARTKGDRSRKVPIPDPLREALSKLPRKKTGYVMAAHHFIADAGALSKGFLRYRKERKDLPEITFHKLRHSYATHLAPHLEITVLKKLMGHQDVRTTMIYTHVQDDTALDAVKDLF